MPECGFDRLSPVDAGWKPALLADSDAPLGGEVVAAAGGRRAG